MTATCHSVGSNTSAAPAPRSRVPALRLEDSRYTVRFAARHADVAAALRLRFEVFNLELGEGLSSSFATYLRRGAAVCGGPALDREFGTVDYLVLLDVEALGSRARRMYLDAA